jgi:UDP-N-acetylmuramoyl-L-alanyl-D-glutamate--2,6-diaminopimelate ligase
VNFSEYTGVYYDSRKLIPGSIFVAIKGEKSDGHEYINSALEKGATLIVAQKNILDKNASLSKLALDNANKFYIVDDTHSALADIANKFYDNPSSKITVLGVTGTNGKTTVTHLLQVLLGNKSSCALLGTMGLKENINSPYKDLKHTTPLAVETQEVLAGLVSEHKDYLVMEVSSHALDQKRVGGINFKGAIITNLTQDHLDYHLTMSAYFEAKAKIFLQTSLYAIINLDDEYAQQFISKAQSAKLKIITYAVNQKADLQATNIKFNDKGLAFDLLLAGSSKASTRFSLRLNGMFNVYNALAVIAAGLEEGMDINLIAKLLTDAPVVAGRFELIKDHHGPACIVDYAHTPDGLLNVLKGARSLIPSDSNAKLICVFGCGGDRDMTKRPKMGKIAIELADYVFVTSDNPRSEDPDQIIADILTGIPDLDAIKVIPDRATAIKSAIEFAKDDDIVVIAGKGHEDYQILKDRTIHFDDREEVRKVLGLTVNSSGQA